VGDAPINSTRLKRYLVVVVVVAGLLMVVVSAWAIRRFGATDVEAFAGVMSFLAVIIAAIATVVYVRQTADIAKATREGADQQKNLARLMEKDLQFRVQPHLRYESLPCTANKPEGQIRNEGSGAAVDLRVWAEVVPSDRNVEILRIPVLAPRHDRVEHTIFNLTPNETDYTVNITCTDSLKFNEYHFKWNRNGQLLDCAIKSRS